MKMAKNDVKRDFHLVLLFVIINFIIILNSVCVFALEEGPLKGSSSYSVIRIDDSYTEDIDSESEEKVQIINKPVNLPAVNPVQVVVKTHDPKYRFIYMDNPQHPKTSPYSDSSKKFSGNQFRNLTEAQVDWSQEYSQGASRAVVTLRNGDETGGRSVVRVQPVQPVLTIANSANLVDSPPPHEQVAKMARFIVKYSNWTSIATISTRSEIRGFPFANVFSVSDGPLDGNCTGIPYMYLTPLEISVIDLQADSRASLTMSLAQGDYCRVHSYDPEDPRCAHVILTGTIVKVDNSTSEALFAQEALFSRHPEMPDWPQDHGWFFAKMDISLILVLDYFGGAKTVTPDQYFKAN